MKSFSTKSKTTSYAEAVPVEDRDGLPRAHLTLTKVVRETIPIGPGGSSMGKFIDDVLAEAVLGGQEVQELTLEVTREYWAALAHEVQSRERRG